MREILNFISENPEYVAMFFVVVNACWIAFVYFNKKHHEKELVKLRQSFDLDLERRKKVFEMKANQYELYFKLIDEIHNRHQTDYEKVFLPIMNEFMSSYLTAATQNDIGAETKATIRFSEKISKITIDGFKELNTIQSETNSLRLLASDEVAKLLGEIEELYRQLFELSGNMMSNLIKIDVNNDQELAEKNKNSMMKIGKILEDKVSQLRHQMRIDLKQI
ncbi:MAG: hypothetical protein L3J41_01590 [Melioribacteraceae bacterium]|nr:hypothetical protein [Melioribacteraceae bacterium]